MLKRLFLTLLTAIVVLALAIGALIASGGLTKVAQWGAETAVRHFGLPIRSLAVTKVSMTELEVGPLALTDDLLTLEKLTVTFSPSDLWNGEIYSLAVKGLVVRVSAVDGHIELPFLGLFAADPATVTPPKKGLLLPPVYINDAQMEGRVVVDNGHTLWQAPFQITGKIDRQAVVMDYGVSMLGNALKIKGKTDFAVRALKPVSGQISTQLSFNNFVDIPGIPAFPIKGQINGAVVLKAETRLSPVVSPSGDLTFDLSFSGTDEQALNGTLSGTLAFKPEGKQIIVRSLPGLAFTANGDLPQDIFEMLVQILENSSDINGFKISGRDGTGENPGVKALFDPEQFGLRVSVDQAYGLTGPNGIAAEARLKAKATITSANFATPRLDVETLDISMEPLSYKGLTLSLDRVRLSGEGGPNAMAGKVDANLRMAGTLEGVTLGQGSVALTGDYKLSETLTAFTARGCQKISAGKMQGKGWEFPRGFDACLHGLVDKPLIKNTKESLEAAASLAIEPIRGAIGKGKEKVTFSGRPPRLQVTAKRLSRDGLLSLASHLKGGALKVGGVDIGIQDIDGQFAGEVAENGPTGALTLGQVTVRSTKGLPLFAPLLLSGKGRLDDGMIAFDNAVSIGPGKAQLTAHGEHRLATGSGTVDFNLAPIVFRSEGLQPKTLSPFLRGYMSDVAGTVKASGRMAWPSLDSSASFTIEDAGAVTSFARIEGLDLILDLDRIWPPSAPPGQSLTVALVDVGVPVTQIHSLFALSPEEGVKAEIIEWPWAGGVLRSRNAVIGLTSGKTKLSVDVEGVDLGQLLPLLKLEGLEGSGLLSGAIPVVLRPDGAPLITGAKLYADGSGVLAYKSAPGANPLAGAGGSADLLSKALEDFRYKTLRAEADGDLGDKLEIRLHLAGHNPSLYDGYPLELNLSLTAGVNQLLKSGEAFTSTPKELMNRLRQPRH